MKKKLISAVLCIAMVSSLALPLTTTYAKTGEADAVKVEESNIPYQLYYDEEAPFGNEDIEKSKGTGANLVESQKDDGWERWSIPLGNGYFGANVFGRTETERIQITDKTLYNPYKVSGQYLGGLNNFSETYIDFGHPFAEVSDYSRTLNLNSAVSYVGYMYDGVEYSREYFTSYPDNAMVIKLDADTEGALNFTLRPTIPYEQDYANTEGDGASKHGQVIASVEDGVGTIELTGKMGYYDIDFMGIYKVITDGTGTLTYNNSTSSDGVDDGTVTVTGGTSAYIIITLGTDYELCEENFLNALGSKPIEKTDLTYTREKIEKQMDSVLAKISGKSYTDGYSKLLGDHLADYKGLFGRVTVDLGVDSADYEMTTDQLLDEYKAGRQSAYLEGLYFQYGRYLLISSSRPGTLPANLQGAWNRYNESPWSSAYWHNINVQMNYWPAFSTNLAETFEAYNAYNDAYMEQTQSFATANITTDNRAALGKDGGNGWTLGVSGWLFTMQNDQTARAPGNVGFLTELYWDWYQYTQDEDLLREVVYPKLADAARFVTKCVTEEDGKFLVIHSDSPEQYYKGEWYFTKGTAYAQSFAYLNNYHTLLAAKELGINLENEALLSQEDYSILKTVMTQLDKYDPIIVGLSGQIKEFREEDYYGDIGEKNHRHISQLVGLYPGNLINETTPAWLDAAKVTLKERGDEATGWGVAHRLNLWARTKDGNRTYKLVEQLLKKNTATNLWDLHPPFQIDGNLGGTAGIAEMLLQSHEGYIAPLSAIPDEWANGQYTGLVARDNFEVSAKWQNGTLKTLNITSLAGKDAKVSYSGIENATVVTEDGDNVNYKVEKDGLISFPTEVGETYYIGGFTKLVKPADVTNLNADNAFLGDTKLSWTESPDAVSYNVYYARENDADYTLLGNTTETGYVFTPEEGYENSRYTFKVMAVNGAGTESDGVLCYRNPEDVSASVNAVTGSVLDNGTLQVTVNATEFESSYKLYKKANRNDAWIFVTESDTPVISMAGYDPDMRYGVSVVSRYYGVESEIVEIKNFGTVGSNITYDASDILAGCEFLPTKEALGWVNGSYSYKNLTDGTADRFATTTSQDAIVDATVNLPGTFVLNELKIYDYQGNSMNSDYAGGTLKVQLGYNGEWTDIQDYKNTRFHDYRSEDDGDLGSYISISLKATKAQQIRVIITPVSGKPVQITEIECTGVLVPDEAVYSDNIFEGKLFEPTNNEASSWVKDATSGYENLTDGTYKGSPNPQRFVTKTNVESFLDGTMDFGGTAVLNELVLYDYNSYDNNADFAGQNIKVEVYNNGTWTTAQDITLVSGVTNNIRLQYRRELNVRDDLKDKWLVIDMGGIKAEKLRLVCSNPFTASKIVSFWEIECSGYLAEGRKMRASDNLFEGKTFTLTEESKGYVHSAAYGAEFLTDGTYKGSVNPQRFSTRESTDAILDATMDFETNVIVNNLLVYDYNAWDNDANNAGQNITVYGYNNGEWKTLKDITLTTGVDGTVRKEYRQVLGQRDPLKDKWLSINIGGQEVSKLRVVFDNPLEGKSISIWELECTGAYEVIEESPELKDSNVFKGLVEENFIQYDGGDWENGDLRSVNDGDVNTVYEVETGKRVEFEFNLGRKTSLYTLDIDLGEVDTEKVSANVSMYIDGQWVNVPHQQLKSNGKTSYDLYGASATKVSVGFQSADYEDIVIIKDISATTGKKPVDRTALVNAFTGIPARNTIAPELLDEYDTQVAVFRGYLADTTASQDAVDSYTKEIAEFDWNSLMDTIPTPEPTPTPVPTEPPVDYIINYEFENANDVSNLGGGVQADGVGGKTDKVFKVTSMNATRHSSRYFESATGYMTYETEFYMTNPATDRFVFQVFNQSNANKVRSGIDIVGGKVKFNAFGTGNFWLTFTESDATIENGWNKVAITWDMNNKNMLFYLNDEKIGEGTVNEMNGVFGGDVAYSDTTVNTVYIDNFRVYANEYYVASTPEPEEFGVNFVTSEVNGNGELIMTYNVTGFATQSESLLKFFLAEKDGSDILLNLWGEDITGNGTFGINVGTPGNSRNFYEYIWETNLTPVE